MSHSIHAKRPSYRNHLPRPAYQNGRNNVSRRTEHHPLDKNAACAMQTKPVTADQRNLDLHGSIKGGPFARERFRRNSALPSSED